MRIQETAIAIALTAMTSAPGAARAQLFDRLSNPRFDVPITHPPQKEANAVAVGESSGTSKSAPSAQLTNEDIIAMMRAKLPAKVILTKIKGATNCKFDTSPGGLIALSQAGASEDVIVAVNEATCGN